jgi:hypothetical protein
LDGAGANKIGGEAPFIQDRLTSVKRSKRKQESEILHISNDIFLQIAYTREGEADVCTNG